MNERYTYDEAFEILQGLTIDHVQFQNNGKPRYIKYVMNKIELQKELDSIYDIFNAKVIFTLGDANDDGTSKHVITLYFDPISKILDGTSVSNPDYSFVSKLVGRNSMGKELHYETFKQVFRTDLDWEWKGLKKRFSRIKSFFGFNESINGPYTAMGTLSKDDTDIIEDLCLEFSEKWNLSFETHDDKYGYISIQRFDKFNIQFGVQTNISFEINHGAISGLQSDRKNFEEDLTKVINRIEKFGYNVLKINSGSQINGSFGGFTTYSFQITHTAEKSNKLLESNDPYIDLKELILEKCQPFIELSKSCDIPIELWRGVSGNFIRNNSKEVGHLVYEVNHIDNRKPTDTPNALHDKLNKEFKNKFGWPVRNGVFCLPDKGRASNYASISSSKISGFDYPEPYFFIPIGNFRYCWSPKYHDLTADIKINKDKNWKEEMEMLSDIKIKNIVNTYKDNNIGDATYTSKRDASEISFECNKYLLISQRYFIGKSPNFWNW